MKDIATALRYGALPVVLKPQTSEIVSATLGRDALHAGLVAGVVGFVLVGLYMIGFYRLLGVLAMLKLVIEGCILWGLLCWIGPNLGLALTLAGITGIIVSIGVSLDSNVVYYEHLQGGRARRAHHPRVGRQVVRHRLVAPSSKADFASVLGAVRPLRLHRRGRARVRPLPRHLDRPRPHHLVVLHAPRRRQGDAFEHVPGAPAPVRPAQP